MAPNKLDDLCARGVIRDECDTFSNFQHAAALQRQRSLYCFFHVGGQPSTFLHVSLSDAPALEAEGYRRLRLHPDDVVFISGLMPSPWAMGAEGPVPDPRPLAERMEWNATRSPIGHLVPLAIEAGYLNEGAFDRDLLNLRMSSRNAGRAGSEWRVVVEELVEAANMWAAISARIALLVGEVIGQPVAGLAWGQGHTPVMGESMRRQLDVLDTTAGKADFFRLVLGRLAGNLAHAAKGAPKRAAQTENATKKRRKEAANASAKTDQWIADEVRRLRRPGMTKEAFGQALVDKDLSRDTVQKALARLYPDEKWHDMTFEPVLPSATRVA